MVKIHSHLSLDAKRIYTHAHDENGKSLVGNVDVDHEDMNKEVYA